MFAYKGPIVTIVMDGVGLRSSEEGNAVKLAYTPVLDGLFQNYQYTSLKAHGTAVGLPSDDDMGNSEVGHNAIGAGRYTARALSWSMNPLSPVTCFGQRDGRKS